MFSGRNQKLYAKRTLDPEYPFELTLELTEDGPNKSVQNTRFSNLFRRFSVFFDLFQNFHKFSGFWRTKGAGIGKFTPKGFFSTEEAWESMIEMPENRT